MCRIDFSKPSALHRWSNDAVLVTGAHSLCAALLWKFDKFLHFILSHFELQLSPFVFYLHKASSIIPFNRQPSESAGRGRFSRQWWQNLRQTTEPLQHT